MTECPSPARKVLDPATPLPHYSTRQSVRIVMKSTDVVHVHAAPDHWKLSVSSAVTGVVWNWKSVALDAGVLVSEDQEKSARF